MDGPQRFTPKRAIEGNANRFLLFIIKTHTITNQIVNIYFTKKLQTYTTKDLSRIILKSVDTLRKASTAFWYKAFRIFLLQWLKSYD